MLCSARYLNNNGLVSLSGSIFASSSAIGDFLYLQQNALPVLPGDTFADVTLTKIDLTYNNIFTYPGAALSTQNLAEM